MTPPALLFVIAAIVALAAVGMGALITRRRHAELKERFGPEYERAVEELGTERAADKELHAREQRVKKLHVHPLNERQRAHVKMEWLKVQSKFVDNPAGSVRAASTLIKSVLYEQGYAPERFDQRLADLSVDHARIVQHYRAARALTDEHPEGQAATEDLRQALVHYRTILEELVEPSSHAAARWREARAN